MPAPPPPALPPLVPVEWWSAHRDEVVTADVRWYLDGRSGRDAYDEGHLPGAVFVDLDRWLTAPPSPPEGRHPLPSPEHFAEGMGRLGIGDDTPVVAYDDAGGLVAARLVWMLRSTGRDAALLDGGIQAYDGALSREEPTPRPAHLTPRPWPPARIAGIDDLHGPGSVLLDARDTERYLGEVEPVDPRAGHIPGARSFPSRAQIGPDGRLAPPGGVRDRLAAHGVTEGTDVIASCGSGVTACHTLLVLEAAGLPPGRLYPGSFSQWSHTERPVRTGPEP